jgi:hypothetical protein
LGVSVGLNVRTKLYFLVGLQSHRLLQPRAINRYSGAPAANLLSTYQAIYSGNTPCRSRIPEDMEWKEVRALRVVLRLVKAEIMVASPLPFDFEQRLLIAKMKQMVCMTKRR